MKKSSLFIAATVTGLIMTQAVADTEVVESPYEVQNTYQHELIIGSQAELSEQTRIRKRDQNRLQSNLADSDGKETAAKNRYQTLQGNSMNHAEIFQLRRNQSGAMNHSSMTNTRSGNRFGGRH